MADFEQDIIRKVRIETQVDTDTIKRSSATLDNFYKKYQSKEMKVDTSDFFQAIDAVRSLRKELDTTKKNSPHMEGIIGQMSGELERAGQQFSEAIIHFTNGDIAKGLNEAVDKISQGFSIKAVDLGDYLSNMKRTAQETTDSLKRIGALTINDNGHKYLNFDGLNIEELHIALALMQKLLATQKEMDNFHGAPLRQEAFYSDYTTKALSNTLDGLRNEIEIISELDLNYEQLIQRRSLLSKVEHNEYGGYDSDNFKQIKINVMQDEEEYQYSLSRLNEHIAETEKLMSTLQNNSNLFKPTELFQNIGILTRHLDEAKLQLQELQQLGGKGGTSPVASDFSELTTVLNEIKASLQIISDVFKNEDAAMRSMAENGITSFTSLSQAIIEVYNNLTRVQGLVDTISQKDFNITNVTQVGGGNSNMQAMTQQMAIARETMEHLRQLYDQAGKTLTLLGQSGRVDLVMEYAQQLQELNLTDINKSIKGANTEMKLASVLAEIQDYIDKLIQINELRNKYNLGEWKDTFIPTQRSNIPPAKQQEEIKIVAPAVELPKETAVSVNTEAQQMANLTGAIDEVSGAIDRKNAGFIKEREIVDANIGAEIKQIQSLKNSINEISNAIGKKNAGFIKEKEIVDTSVEAEKIKLRELVTVITTEIGNALDSIKTKFAQSFVVPELDKNNLQASFDEIYNKFVDLKDKIQTMEIDIGINTANITTAIQKALYAKEIQGNFRQIDFTDAFVPDMNAALDGKDWWVNQFTGEVITSMREATGIFEKDLQNLWVRKNETSISEMFTTEQMLDTITRVLNAEANNQQSAPDDWVQVIVEAINTQGSKIVESIKLLIPKNITDNVDENKLISAFDILTKAIQEYTHTYGGTTEQFFKAVEKGQIGLNDNTIKALNTLGLFTNGNPTFTIAGIGGSNDGIALGKDLVYNAIPSDQIGDVYELMEKQNKAHELGAQVARIIAAHEENGKAFRLETKLQGRNFRTDPVTTGVLDATDEQIDRLLHTFEMLEQAGLVIEFGGDNVLYDKDKGFSLVDLAAESSPYHWDDQDTATDMFNSFMRHMDWTEDNVSGADKAKIQDLKRRMWERYNLSPEERLVNANTIAAERAQQTSAVNAKVTPIMDEGAVAKVVEENVAKTPATVKVTPVIDSRKSRDADNYDTDALINKYIDAAKGSNPSEQVNELLKQNPLLDGFNDGVNGLLTSDAMFRRMAQITEQELDHFRERFEHFVNGTGSDQFANGFASKGMIDAQRAVDATLESQQAIDAEGQEAFDVAKQFVEAANAKLKFVEANKQVAKSAEESAESVKKEAEAIESIDVELSNDASTQGAESHKKNTEAIEQEIEAEKELAKVKDKYKDGSHVRHEEVYKYQQDGANITENVATDDAGNEIITLVKDFEAFNREEKKTEESIARVQSKLDEFIKRFKSKTGGNAQFVEGFNELANFKINKDNIEEAFNLMTKLQAKYNELEGNFRKGQASLNPFTNAINKASNIDNIFGEVEDKYNALSDTSALEEKFNKLQGLSQQIKAFVEKINTAPDTITSKDFTEFSKQVGEFNLLKTQLEGSIKRQGRAEAIDAKKQAESYAEILRLVKEKNKLLETAAKADDGSIKQRNALMDAYQIEQQLHTLGQQIVLTDKQRAELARIREEQARKIRDIEADNKVKADTQRASTREQKRKKEVEDYIQLLKQQYDYEKKAAKEDKGSRMQSFYNEKIAEIKERINKVDIQSIANQDEKNKLLALEKKHQEEIAEIQLKKSSGGKKSTTPFGAENEKLQKKHEAGYLSDGLYNNWQKELSEYQNYITGVIKADEATIQAKKQHLMQLYDHLNKISNASKSFFASGGEILSKVLSQDEIKNASASLKELYQTIVTERFDGMKTSITGVSDKLGRLNFVVNDGKGSLTQYTLALDKASGATKILENNVKATKTALQQAGQILKKDFTGLLHAVIGGTGIYAFVNYIRQGIQAVRELDLALTELKKVTDETEEVYDRFLSTAASTSARIGSTLSNMTSATAEFAKLGYNIEQAAAMAESALVYTNVGDNVDVETGSQSIISTLKAFGIEANNTMSIVDKFNEVGELIAQII